MGCFVLRDRTNWWCVDWNCFSTSPSTYWQWGQRQTRQIYWWGLVYICMEWSQFAFIFKCLVQLCFLLSYAIEVMELLLLHLCDNVLMYMNATILCLILTVKWRYRVTRICVSPENDLSFMYGFPGKIPSPVYSVSAGVEAVFHPHIIHVSSFTLSECCLTWVGWGGSTWLNMYASEKVLPE